jgi:magnesium-transporting ATPase (P-type)
MTTEPDKRKTDTPEPAGQAGAAPSPDEQSDAILPFGDRLDEIAQGRFNRTDWIELVAAFILAAATIMAAWSAYQSTRWSGNQANASAAAGALRAESNAQTALFGATVGIDVQMWTLWLGYAAAEDASSMAFVSERFRDEFKPAFAAWLGSVPDGEPPPSTPFALELYAPATEAEAQRLSAAAELKAAEARKSNQIGDNFVLMAVIMASVLFFAGIGTKFKGRLTRLIMISIAMLLFTGGLLVILSLPQDVGVEIPTIPGLEAEATATEVPG